MVTRKDLFDILYEKDGLGRSNRTKYLLSYLVGHYKIEDDEDTMLKLKIINSKFCSAVYSKLDQSPESESRVPQSKTRSNETSLSDEEDEDLSDIDFD